MKVFSLCLLTLLAMPVQAQLDEPVLDTLILPGEADTVRDIPVYMPEECMIPVFRFTAMSCTSSGSLRTKQFVFFTKKLSDSSFQVWIIPELFNKGNYTAVVDLDGCRFYVIGEAPAFLTANGDSMQIDTREEEVLFAEHYGKEVFSKVIWQDKHYQFVIHPCKEIDKKTRKKAGEVIQCGD